MMGIPASNRPNASATRARSCRSTPAMPIAIDAAKLLSPSDPATSSTASIGQAYGGNHSDRLPAWSRVEWGAVNPGVHVVETGLAIETQRLWLVTARRRASRLRASLLAH